MFEHRVHIAQSDVTLEGRWLKRARVTDEWHVDVDKPEALVSGLRELRHPPDLFTFWQRLPDVEPRFPYFHEGETIAALPISTYDEWFTKTLSNKTRNLINKSIKRGVVVRPAAFDDEFVAGMAEIFNESPIRQGTRFWHYGKSPELIKQEFSKFLYREQIIGAYYEGELIGFAFIVDAGRFAMLGQIISAIRHRDKSPNNALIAKAVEICAGRNVPFLTYAMWPRPGTLREFKRHNGFEPVELPRYFVPVTATGRIALRLGMHRGAAAYLPEPLVLRLKGLRSRVYDWRYRHVRPAASGPAR